MDATTGLILRRITQTNLSVAVHRLATLTLLLRETQRHGYTAIAHGPGVPIFIQTNSID